MEAKHCRSEFDKIKVGNKRKLFVKENGVKGAYCFMKLPYRQFHRDYQPDGMHTVTDVVKTVMNWLTGNVDINKLRQAEEEFKSVRPEKITDKIVTLTVKEKPIGNHRCRSLKFPKDFSGFSGDVFTNPTMTLKNTHGWTEVRFSFCHFFFFVELLSCLLNKNTISK